YVLRVTHGATMNDEPNLNLAHIVRPSPRYSKGGAPESGVPCLLLLHGRGADEADLMGMEEALDPRFTVVSVRAPFRLPPGFAWYDMPDVGEPEADTVRGSLDESHAFIEGLPDADSIDPQRMYMMRFSAGVAVGAATAVT